MFKLVMVVLVSLVGLMIMGASRPPRNEEVEEEHDPAA